MITIKNIKMFDGKVENYRLPSSKDYTIEADGQLLLFPGIINPHAYCPPGLEMWKNALKDAINGGITTIIEWPKELLQSNSKKNLEEKNKKIADALSTLKFAPSYFYYLGYEKEHLNEIGSLGLEKKFIKGVAIHLLEKKNDPVDVAWENLFRFAAQEDIPIVMDLDKSRAISASDRSTVDVLHLVIDYVEKWSNRLCVLGVKTEEEINLIQEARKNSLLVFAETSLEHLFSKEPNQPAHLWKAIQEDVIEMIGSGNSHSQSSKIACNEETCCLSNPRFMLPFLYTAYEKGKISLEKLAGSLSMNAQDIFEIHTPHDIILIDQKKEKAVRKIDSDGSNVEITLRGWPAYTIVHGDVYPIQ